MGATSRAGAANPSEAPVTRSLVLPQKLYVNGLFKNYAAEKDYILRECS
jgi:hypothetical protein